MSMSNVHSCVKKKTHLAHLQSQLNRVDSLRIYFFNIYLILSLHLHLGSLTSLFVSLFQTKKGYAFPTSSMRYLAFTV
jgi:hypothetical protein